MRMKLVYVPVLLALMSAGPLSTDSGLTSASQLPARTAPPPTTASWTTAEPSGRNLNGKMFTLNFDKGGISLYAPNFTPRPTSWPVPTSYRYRRYNTDRPYIPYRNRGYNTARPYIPYRYRGYNTDRPYIPYRNRGYNTARPYIPYRYRGYITPTPYIPYKYRGYNTARPYIPYRYRGYITPTPYIPYRYRGYITPTPYIPYRYRGYITPTPYIPYRYRGYTTPTPYNHYWDSGYNTDWPSTEPSYTAQPYTASPPTPTRGVSVCLRFLNDFQRGYQPTVFTLSPSSSPLSLRVYDSSRYALAYSMYSQHNLILRPDIRFWSYTKPEIWTRICVTVDGLKNVAQVFKGPDMSIRKMLSTQYVWSGEPEIDFPAFDGQLTDVQVWDYPLRYNEVFNYMTRGALWSYSGNVLTWSSISYSFRGNALLEDVYDNVYEKQAKQPISSCRGRGRCSKKEKKTRKSVKVKDKKLFKRDY